MPEKLQTDSDGGEISRNDADAPELNREAKKLTAFTQTRLQVGRIIDTPWYERIQRAATYTSVFGETLYRGGCGALGFPVDETVADFLRLAPLPLFAGNFGMKMVARGPSHIRTPEAWIDMLSVAAECSDQLPLGNARLARLLKGVRGAKQIAKFMRAVNVGMERKSLEDKSMFEINEYLTWYLMGLLASLPLVADYKHMDYSNPLDTLGEVTFNVGVVGGAKWLNSKIRGVINQNYTRTLNCSRDRVHQMIDNNPELEFLRDNFEYFDQKASERIQKQLGLTDDQVRQLVIKMKAADQSAVHPSVVWREWTSQQGIDTPYEDYADDIDRVTKDEITVIVEGLCENLIAMKDLINPVGEDLRVNERGEIETKEIDAVVMVTDLRNFTPLTTSKKIRGNIFGFLKINYFAYLKHSIKRHGGKILNHTGDGLVIYFTNQKGHDKEVNAIACAEEINRITNLMDQVWHHQGVANPEDNHQTGIGLATGTIRIGDVLTLSAEKERAQDPDSPPESTASNILDVQSAFEREAARICDWIDIVAEERRQGGISRLVGMGEPINIAARLESIAKAFPNHTAFIRRSQYEMLPGEIRDRYESLEAIELKGVDSTEMIYGLPRYKE